MEGKFSKRCLICYTKVEEGLSKKNVQPITIISRQLHVIFVLRKLFLVPLKNLEEYLSKLGNPQDWIALCPNCNEDTEKAKQIYTELLKATKKFKAFRNELTETVKLTCISMNTDDGDKTNPVKLEPGVKEEVEEGVQEITEEIRSVINQGVFQVEVDPFIAGDLKASQLVRNQRIRRTKAHKRNPTCRKAAKLEPQNLPTDDSDKDGEGDTDSQSKLNKKRTKSTTLKCSKSKNPCEKVPCPDCDKILSSSAALQTHIKLCHTPPSHFCYVCGKGYPMKCYLDRHLVQAHNEGSHLRRHCEVEGCGRIFNTERLLRCHMDQHNNSPRFKCDVCQKPFYFPHKLKRHQNSVHKFVETRPFQCDHCGASYPRQDALHTHLKKRAQVGECPISRARPRRKKGSVVPGKSGVSEEGIKAETSSSQDSKPKARASRNTLSKSIVCHICGKTYGTRVNLDYHIKFIHDRKFPVHCDLCGKGMRSRSCLKKHRATAHNIGNKLEFMKQCTFEGCGKYYPSELILNDHLTTHTKEPKFTCEQCGKSFYYKFKLLRHERLHRDKQIRPYPCLVCGKSFARNDYVKLHMKSHNKAGKVEESK